jgi:hypothetical protein
MAKIWRKRSKISAKYQYLAAWQSASANIESIKAAYRKCESVMKAIELSLSIINGSNIS